MTEKEIQDAVMQEEDSGEVEPEAVQGNKDRLGRFS